MLNYDFVKNYEIAAKDLYLRSLISPETTGAKIPSPLPISSTTACLRDNITIMPNSLGKFLLVIDPFRPVSKLYTNDQLTGDDLPEDPGFRELNFSIDSNIVDQFRLVSAGVILRYYGNFNQMSGLFVGAVTSDPSGQVHWYDFKNIEDLTNKYISKCVDGIKLVYSPMDNKATEFVKTEDYTRNEHPLRNQYLFVIAGDLFPSTACIRLDYYRNYEYTTKPKYREYITQTKSLPIQFEIPALPDQSMPAPTAIQTSIINPSYTYNIMKDFDKLGFRTRDLLQLPG